MSNSIIAYKGFNKNLQCRDFQYEIGGEYEESVAKICESGFHACEDPLDCLRYYSPSESRYCRVELTGVMDRNDVDSKVCATNIKILEELTLREMTEIAVEIKTNTGHRSASTNTGHRSASANTGDCSAASVGSATSIAISWGMNGRASGVIGSHLVLCEWERNWETGESEQLGAKMVQVDGETVKENTWYALHHGELCELESQFADIPEG